MSSFYEWSSVKTRKDHKCDGCLCIIPKSDKVETCKGRNDGVFYKIYVCNDCVDYLTEFRDRYEDGWVSGEIGHDRREAKRANEMNTV